MSFTSNGLIQRFLDLLGVSIQSETGIFIAFIIVSAIVAISLVSLMLLIFKFLVFLRKG